MERLLKEGRMAKMEHNRMTPRQQLPAFGEKDPQLQARVRTLFKDNFFSVMVTMLYGLVCLMYVPSVSNVLEATKKTNTRVGAFSRYLNTINHVIAWIGKDMLARRQSLLQVRMLHTRANRTAVAKYGQDGAMSQFDMVVTQWAFVGPFFIFPERVGISTITRRDLEAIAHYMYVVGYVMGVKDEFNLCAGSPEEVTRYCKFVHEKVILPCLEQPHSRAIDMATRLLNGMEHLNPFIRPSSFIACMLKAFKADSHRSETNSSSSLIPSEKYEVMGGLV